MILIKKIKTQKTNCSLYLYPKVRRKEKSQYGPGDSLITLKKILQEVNSVD